MKVHKINILEIHRIVNNSIWEFEFALPDQELQGNECAERLASTQFGKKLIQEKVDEYKKEIAECFKEMDSPMDIHSFVAWFISPVLAEEKVSNCESFPDFELPESAVFRININ